MTRTLAALFAGAVAVAACSGPGDTELLVSAAASLTDAFGDIEVAFEAEHPDVDVVLNLAGSSALREQILAGSPSDVFASADPGNMTPVVAAGDAAGDPVVFAINVPALAVPPGNPGGVTGLVDLSDPPLLVGLCAAEVPCGALAAAVFAEAGVTPSVDTFESDVRALLTKLAAGELDAGIVYETDVLGSGGGVEAVALPQGVDEATEYPIVALDGGDRPELAEQFVGFVLSDDGRGILAEHGFRLP